MIERCPRCHRWKSYDSHTCPPAWNVRQCADPDSVHTIYEASAQEAAEAYMHELVWYHDYTSSRAEVEVQEGGVWIVYQITIEYEPSIAAVRKGVV